MDKENEKELKLLRALLRQVKTEDPYLKQLFEKQIQGLQMGTSLENTKEIIRCLRIQNKKLLEQVSTLKLQVKEMATEREKFMSVVNYISKLNNNLSEALGSCLVCWGEDPTCTHCNGNGLPGWRDINKRQFNIYVLPCLEKLYGITK